ncbi:aminotransferase class V-fold PLP-dependent enzyme [Silvimonas iriomotensis]|uniref:Probable cysteine desulfurase n=1 Tax=Silvimonas iriomotensis TaxID=449662 RepID=A0ABQ2P6R1_9NEIS|nr:cysteine desulfurase [Silvimonas iriomotensis]GGP19275.1 cysteine desulfurase [Silvimonas iriomotensis]
MDHSSLPDRASFPLLAANPDLVWLDNAATTQKPGVVLDAERRFYEESNANVHRGGHRLGYAATEAYEAARNTVARFINASAQEIVFTRGATEAINLVAYSWGGSQLKAGDEIILSTLEHHANIVPWQLIAQRTGAVIRPIPLQEDGQIDMTAFASLLGPRTRMVAISQMSNALGVCPPLEQIIEAARSVGARVLVDGAQGIAHQAVDVAALGADFYVFSGHKVFGPTGIGVLWGRAELLADMPPWQGGGEMIERVSFAGTTFAPAPRRFEAGTPAFAQTVALAAALEWLSAQDRPAIARHEAALYQQLAEGIRYLDGVRIVGNAPDKGPIASLVFGRAHPYDVAQFLDERDIAVRVGNHCAGPLMQSLGLSQGTLRVSLALYNTSADIERLLAALQDTLELLQ